MRDATENNLLYIKFTGVQGGCNLLEDLQDFQNEQYQKVGFKQKGRIGAFDPLCHFCAHDINDY